MKDVEIGKIGETKVYMNLDELFRIANREVKDYADGICRNNSELLYKLEQATEALRFYAYADIHKYHQDKGDIARNFLKEIVE